MEVKCPKCRYRYDTPVAHARRHRERAVELPRRAAQVPQRRLQRSAEQLQTPHRHLQHVCKNRRCIDEA